MVQIIQIIQIIITIIRTAGILRIKQTHLDRITMEILRENQIIQTMVHRMAERTMLRLVQIQQIKAV